MHTTPGTVGTGSSVHPEHDALESALRAAVQGEVFTDLTRRGVYATDASHYQMMPRAVVVPRHEQDVAAVLRIAREMNVPITGRGGGTSLAGQTFGTGIVLDFSKYMNALVEVNAEERWAIVQPGIVRDALNRQIQHTHLHFAPDPATTSRATVGGMIANNSSGMHSVIYGKTIDHIIALRVMLADGEIVRLEPCDAKTWLANETQTTRLGELYRGVGNIVREQAAEIEARFPKVMRRVGGYNLDELIPPPGKNGGEQVPTGGAWNLSRLICGSEGTLGVILQAKVNLVPLPGATCLCVLHFDDLIESLRHVPTMLEYRPSAIELLDEFIIREARISPATRHMAGFISGEPTAVLIVEFMADSAEQAQQKARDFARAMQQRGIGTGYTLCDDPVSINHVWEVRRLGVGLQSNVKGTRKPLDFVDDACVPVEHLAEYIQRLREVCTKHGVLMPVSSHASVGVLHPKPMLDLHDPEDVRKMRAIAYEAFEMVRQYHGSWSGEHGDGQVRGEFIRAFFGDALYAAFGQVKQLFDPQHLLNPGKILDTPAMTEHLRHGMSGYQQRLAEVKAHFHYRDQDGFAHAVEQCNGVGACRKIDVGTMCPSYMATRDEEASTRGRANALRLAMSGQLEASPNDALAGDGVAHALELCLACKACKSECPNSVDMAKLKSDVLQMRHDRHGLPLGYRIMGNAPMTAAWIAGPLASLVNAVQKLGPFKQLMQRITGIDARRPYPSYARKPFKSRQMTPTADNRPTVVLFDDTYARYYEPRIATAAVELLTHCGYRVVAANAGCCQRPRLSKGMVRDAARDGEKTLRNLDRFAAQGLPIVCLEPSCASALVDDLPDLIDDEALGARIKQQVKMLDTFLADEFDAGRIRATLTAATSHILLHGHCHQKALFGTEGMLRLFGRIEGLQVREVDAGCCGMAGSFGYEHYDLSMAIGDQRLFPAIKQAMQKHPDTAICANGFSCRHQVADGCHVKAHHWVELIRATPSAH